MGRHKLTRQEQLRRVIEAYPEVVLLPPAQHRTCKDCWFRQESEHCPFGDPKEPSLAGCVEQISKWNGSVLQSYGYMFETEALFKFGTTIWRIKYKLNGEEKIADVPAKTAGDALAELSKKLPEAVAIGVERDNPMAR